MKTFEITQEEFNSITRMIDFAEYWLEDREYSNDQWRSDNEEVLEAIHAMEKVRERVKNG